MKSSLSPRVLLVYRCSLVGACALALILLKIQTSKPDTLPQRGCSVSHILEKIPREDRKNLELFFREAIAWNCFGYVLFGEKPLAMGEYYKSPLPFKSWADFCFALSPRRIKHVKALETWRKYEAHFPIQRFHFLYEEDEKGFSVFFLSKNHFSKKVNDHLELFKHHLHPEISGEGLLEQALVEGRLPQALLSEDILLGTLLGYGQKNAQLFYKRSQLGSEEEKEVFNQTVRFGDPWIEEEVDTHSESVSWMSAFVTGEHLEEPELIQLPGFCAATGHKETLNLKRHYWEVRQKMIEYYKGRDFLEATLEALCL